MHKAKIKEYFVSVQGEGTYVGYRQLFIRFCGCNLNCSYCDTDFSQDDDCMEVTPGELFKILDDNNMFDCIHSVSLTGGEPLIHADFLKEFLPMLDRNIKVFLETNATLTSELIKVLDYVDIISADIKLPSSSGRDLFLLHEEFFKHCSGKDTFLKVVFDSNITQNEIKKISDIASKYDLELVLSPVMKDNKPVVSQEFMQKVLVDTMKNYKKVRLIPQVHKFLGIE